MPKLKFYFLIKIMRKIIILCRFNNMKYSKHLDENLNFNIIIIFLAFKLN